MLCKSGHAFIKEKMREVDAVYGGEMSAHHYFKEFSYCDSGMIPWLQVAEVHERRRPAAVGDGGGADRAISGERRDQSDHAATPRGPSAAARDALRRQALGSTRPTG